MSTLIPSSALKFYAENTHVTEVTGGTSVGDILYPKLTFPFTMPHPDGVSDPISIIPPYKGRNTLTVNKTFNCGSSSIPFIASLIGYELGSDGQANAGISLDWTGIGEIYAEQGGPVYQDGVEPYETWYIPRTAGSGGLSFERNSQYNKGQISFSRGAVVSIHINGNSVSEQNFDNYLMPGDTGSLQAYDVDINFSLPENTGVEDIYCGYIEFNNEDNSRAFRVNIVQLSQVISLSTYSVTLNPNTGVASSPVTVAAEANWTIS